MWGEEEVGGDGSSDRNVPFRAGVPRGYCYSTAALARSRDFRHHGA